ncbi:glycosyltransferase [Dokdonia sp. Dokd-P16]|uniref:glycosyltransferase n=1 Tax=Dokdonia sp. Dokd-P16 TaxID=2173169 RepID=UPI0013A5664C|nr:glycosyltransferase [Dokdonia sp. Dokd-P16]
MGKIAVIVPCFNETARLDVISYQQFILGNSDFHFYFVDDGSSDRTYEFLVNNFGELHGCQILKSVSNVGKGRVIQYVLKSINLQSYCYFSFIDADLEIPLNQLISLQSHLALVPDNSLALSYRTPKKMANVNWIRKTGSFVVKKIAQNIVGFKTPLRDTQCGCKMFNSQLAFLFQDEFLSSWLFDIELILRFKDSDNFERSNIVEVELLELISNSGSSNITIRTIPKLIMDIYKISRCYK